MTAHAEHRHEHAHPGRSDLEDQAFDHYQLMAEAIGALLIAKGVFGADDLRRTLEAVDARSPADGARLVARAWGDPAFRARVLEDVNAAARELGIDVGAVRIQALENTPRLHNVVVCTLCSCYPRGLLGLPPDWYKARAYRSRTIREPRAVLAEFGTRIPDEVEIRVHDSTADLRYLVLPLRPPGSEEMSEAELAALVTRDCLIGTAVPEVGP
jgi:nitrile hydratase subunit alpha